ncbi:MAG: hypothetical protein H6636_10360, partial [Anaerolineales bacterium]|nr:hypothetical protein [Anaerolineales bacterium]
MTNNLPPLPLQWMTFDPKTGEIPGAEMSARRLSDLKGLFEDSTAYEQLVS